ncbi:MAG: helix-turn-helix domain-containing protein [Bacilli bacterium]|jgi:transcriptional regulator with XRE-family HTH domain|nr:helix-turn-helix domain-containing protein [Bacilli bacterium]
MDETFGQRFQRLRKEKGLTQENIADQLHVSSQAVSKWETDASLPDITLLSAISDILDVSIDELLGKEKTKPAAFVPPSSPSDYLNKLLKIRVISADGDRVRVNFPVSLLEMMLKAGGTIDLEGASYLKNIDFRQLIEMVKKGAIGNLIDVQSEDGDIVQISVE